MHCRFREFASCAVRIEEVHEPMAVVAEGDTHLEIGQPALPGEVTRRTHIVRVEAQVLRRAHCLPHEAIVGGGFVEERWILCLDVAIGAGCVYGFPSPRHFAADQTDLLIERAGDGAVLRVDPDVSQVRRQPSWIQELPARERLLRSGGRSERSRDGHRSGR